MFMGLEVTLSAESFSWLRGPARNNSGWLELDRDRATEYSPSPEDTTILTDLTGVRTPADAIAFIKEHGLLFSGPEATDFREPFQEWEPHVAIIRAAIRVHLLLNRVVKGPGEAEAMGDLRRHWEPVFQRGVGTDATWSDELLLRYASGFVGEAVSHGLSGVAEGVVSLSVDDPTVPVNVFVQSPQAQNLLGVVYHELAMLIVGQVPLEECGECGRLYVVEDKRQRFCSKKCGGRARYRRWKEEGNG